MADIQGNGFSHPVRVGVISDTHGLLRPEAIEALQGVDQIVHAGDIGNPRILDDLRRIAPVSAVRGNVDLGSWALDLPTTQLVEAGKALLYVVHDLSTLDLDPRAAGFQVVISGHSHRPLIERREEVLFVNPGSAGPRRFRLPVSLVRLEISDQGIVPQLVQILDTSP
jgi:putative phosphoesterase